MAKIENSIGWCDLTTNAVTGCDKVSRGCKNCYAESGTRARVLRANGIETWGPKGQRSPVNFEPVFQRLNKLCVCDKCHEAQRWLDDDGRMKGYQCFKCCAMNSLRRIRLFADSNSDWLDPKWPVDTLARFLDAIRLAPNVDVLLLTKRIENWRARLVEVEMFYAKQGKGNCDAFLFIDDWLGGKSSPNIWLGVSVEDQKRADERIPLLLKTPATVRFLSVEPLLDSVDLNIAGLAGTTVSPPIDWVIVGGESGKNRRDCGVEAIASVVDQCVKAGVPVYCKQDCALLPGQQGRIAPRHWERKEFPCV